MRPTRVVIDLIKLENNIKEIKSQLDSKTAIMAIVKLMPMVMEYWKLPKQP